MNVKSKVPDYITGIGNSKRIECIETGVVYPSIKSAIEDLGFPPVEFTLALKYGLPTSDGNHWKQVKKNSETAAKMKNTIQKRYKCITSGRLYNSYKEAAEGEYMSIGSIRVSITENKECCGTRWEIVYLDENGQEIENKN